ncbi:MAG: 5'-3' exonuclease H3TH domain-containing protein [Patescibacteria group bacterium]
MSNKRFIIIDANSLIHRAYHALPPLSTSKGEKISAVYGFLLIFLKALKEFQPSWVAAAFDLPGLTFRHKEFKDYKAKRVKAPEDFYQQIPKVKEILKNFNVPVFEKEGFEADDIIGTISKIIPQSDPEIETIIISGDLDVLQLIDENTKVYTSRKGLKDTILYDQEKVKERYGLSPSQLIDFKGLKGDPSDNIPGVPGIGEKTAIKLIKDCENIENLYLGLDRVDQRLRLLLEKNKEQAFLSKMLVQIRRDLPIDFNLEKCRFGDYRKENVTQAFNELEFYTLLKRI